MSTTRFLNRSDERTGRLLSKRQLAPLIIAEVEKSESGRAILRRIIRLAARWDQFHLAENEFEARATVHKARDVLQIVEEMETREAQLREDAKRAQARRPHRQQTERERRERDEFKEGLLYLLRMFDGLPTMDDHRRVQVA